MVKTFHKEEVEKIACERRVFKIVGNQKLDMFVRDTRSHEHGYSGFDYINNKLKPILRYPEKENPDV